MSKEAAAREFCPEPNPTIFGPEHLESGSAVRGSSYIEFDVLTRYDKELFFQRFYDTLHNTNGYDGTIDEALDTAEHLPSSQKIKNSAPDALQFPEQARQFKILADRIKNARIGSVVIEAAHTYLHDDVEDPKIQESILAQCGHAGSLTRFLETEGIDVRQVIFIDDYNPPRSAKADYSKLNKDRLIELANSAGYAPDLLLREASMVPLAKSMIRFMDEHQGEVKEVQDYDIVPESEAGDLDNGNKLVLSYRNIELYRPQSDFVTCSMLDAAFTVLKLRHFGEAVINVLPRRPENQPFSYKGQQEKMRNIIKEHYRVRVLPAYNLFTGDSHSDPIAAGAHNALRKPH